MAASVPVILLHREKASEAGRAVVSTAAELK